MSEEITQAVQIIRVGIEGMELVFKVGSGGLAATQKFVKAIAGLLQHEKIKGQTGMKKLLLRGGDLQVFQFRDEDLKKVKKFAKKYGILYSVLPSINKNDGLSEIVFHSEAVPRVNMLIQKLKEGKIATFEEFLSGENEKNLDKLTDFLEKEKVGNVGLHTDEARVINESIDNLIEKVGLYAIKNKSVSVEDIEKHFDITTEKARDLLKQLEVIGALDKTDTVGKYIVSMDQESFINRIRGYQDLAERMKAIAKSKDPNLADVTISKSLIAKESQTAVKTRIPGMWGDNARYIWIPKENIIDIHKGKTMLSFIDKEKDYKLYDEDNRVVSTMKGAALYKNHYDQVETAVRDRYEKLERLQQKKRAKDVQKMLSEMRR